MIFGSVNFNAQSKTLIADYAKKGQYEMVERFFCYASSDESIHFASKEIDGTHVDVYPCIVKQPRYIPLSDGSHPVIYDTLEEAIGFSFFNLPSSFAYQDNPSNKGMVQLHLSGGQEVALHFDNKDKEEGEINYYLDFYSFVSQFASLTIYITRDDYLSIASDASKCIESISLFDGNGVSYVDCLAIEKEANFNHPMFVDYLESTNNYGAFMEVYGQTISENAFTEKQRLQDEIDHVTSSHENYHPKPEKTIILTTDSFILTISISASAYIAIAIVVTKLIFFRKKD